MFKEKNLERLTRIGLNNALQRKLKGYTQAQLAEAVNISRTHMSNIEAPNVKTSISLELLFDIADTLQIEPSILLQTDSNQ